MRATLTSLAILALLCPAGICVAQDAAPDKASLEAADEAAKATNKAEAPKPSASASPDSPSEPNRAKPGKGRVGALSADEAKRAARARKRAAAEFKGRGAPGASNAHKNEVAKSREAPTRDAARAEPKRATTAPPADKAEKGTDTPTAADSAKKAEAAEAKQPAKVVETPRAKEPVRATVAPQKNEPSNQAGTAGTLADKEPVKSAEKPALKEPARTAETSRASDSHPAMGSTMKKATRSPDSRRARTGSPRVRYRYAGDATAPRVGDVVPPGVRLGPVPRRYWRYGQSDGRVVGADRRRRYFVERFADRPRPPWRFMAGGPVMEAYPPYPGPFATYGPYPPQPVYVEP